MKMLLIILNLNWTWMVKIRKKKNLMKIIFIIFIHHQIVPTSNASYRSPSLCTSNILKKQQVNRRRAFFHDDVIVSHDSHNHSTTTDDNQQILTTINANDDPINEETSVTLANNSEDNQSNKPFKRKVVSFSTMPFEKKVADGMCSKQREWKKEDVLLFFLIISIENRID